MAAKEIAVKKYVVRLSVDERAQLDDLIHKGKRSAQLLTKARILLKADVSEAGEGWSDSRIAEALDTSVANILRTRRQLVEEGFEAVLTRKYNPNSARPRIFDGVAEAKLITLACGPAPEGHAKWSLRLLEEKVVELHIVEFAARGRTDIRFVSPQDTVAAFPEQTRASPNPLRMPVKLSHKGTMHEIGLVPDLVFGLHFSDGSRRCFMVEIDRGTMPIVRTDFLQTSFERKMGVYLAAYAAKQHERHFGWKAFRVLTVTTDQHRMQSMMDALRQLRTAHSPGASLFFFATRQELAATNPLAHSWRDGSGRPVHLI